MDNIKKFEDFLDRMQGLLDNAKKQGHIIVRVEDLENTFPELKESDDERIRKAIIEHFEGSHSCMFPYKGFTKEQILAWLERQGTELSVYQDALYRIATILSQHEDREGSPLEQIRSIVVDSSLSAMDFEKKELKNIEQKIIISKFKVGDIIQFKGYGHNKYTIKEVIGSTHYINSDGNRMDMSYTDANFELVSPPTNNDIKDALRTEYEKGRADAIAEMQKFAWSKEDEKKRTLIIDILNVNHPNEYFKVNPVNTLNMEAMHTEELVSWLESLKDRYMRRVI